MVNVLTKGYWTKERVQGIIIELFSDIFMLCLGIVGGWFVKVYLIGF